MKFSNKILVTFILLIAVTVLCRFIPLPKGIYGFTPVYALMLFSGIIFRSDKKWAFVLPLMVVAVSDIIYQELYNAGQSSVWGFYKDQLLNYALYAFTVCVGFFVRKQNVKNVVIAAIAAPTLFYILSNFSYWAFVQSYYGEHKTLLQCYIDGLPFYMPWSIVSTVLYSGVLFGIYYGIQNIALKKVMASH